MRKGLIALSAGAMLAAMLLAGCGEDSSTASITKDQFVKRANAICERTDKQVVADFGKYAREHRNLTDPNEADYARFVDVVMVSNVEREVEELEALGAPPGDEDAVDTLVESRAASIEAAEADPALLVNQSEKLFAESSKLATEYGLEDCDDR